MVTLRMAFRNIFRHKRRSLFTGLSIMGGFTLAVIFIGWADGSYNGIIEEFTRNRLGHIQIHEKTYLDQPSLYKTIDQTTRLAQILDETPGVEAWAPRLYSAGLAAVGEKSAGVAILGIDPQKENRTTRFDQKIVSGRTFSGDAAKEAILGQGLAEILEAGLRDEIVIISQASDGSIANDLYTIVGILSSGDEASDRTSFYLTLTEAQELMALEGRVHEIVLTVDRLSRVQEVNDLVAARIDDPALSVTPWQTFAKAFYEAMQTDKAGMYVELIVIVLIVAIGVLNTVLMSVLERRREYGLMKAIGTKPRQIVGLVLLEVIILTLISIAIGSGLGFGANTFLSKHGVTFGEFSYGGMEFGILRAEVNLRSFVIPMVTVILAALVVSLIPAVKAARTEPAKTMRMH